MANGVRSNNISKQVAVADSFLVNRNDETALQSYSDLATQLAGTGALADRLDNYETVTASGAVAYATIADGLANTSDGEFFTVPGESAEDFLVLYQNNAGVADTIKTYPSGEAITAEVNERTNADTFLQSNIDDEASARANADTALQSNIDDEASVRANADTALQSNINYEATARTNADTALQSNINDEATARTNADTALQSNINDEASTRANADTALQTALNASLPTSDAALTITPLITDGEKALAWVKNGKLETIDRVDQEAFQGSSFVPLITDGEKALAWVKNGKLETIDRVDQEAFQGSSFVPLITDGEKALAWVKNGKLETIDRVDQEAFQGSSFVPLITDGEKALVWLENGLLNAAPVAAGFARNVDVMSSRFATHGSSLHRWRAALAKFRVSQSNRVKILIAGDSWVEQSYISAAIKNVLGGYLVADGFHSPVNGNEINRISFSKTGGWTLLDGSGTSDYPYGIGPSGYQIYTDATDGTATLTDFYGTNIRIYRHNHGGTWRYQVDSGGWTTVEDSSDGLMEYLEISGLSDDLHTLEIDTTGNAGIVAIDGFYSWRDGISGFEVSRLGNGGVRSTGMARWHEELVQFAEDMQPDVIITILGTNDQWSTLPANHYAAITDLIIKTRAVMPDMGFIIITPPQSNPSGYSDGSYTADYKLKDFAAADRSIARDSCVEHLSLVDLMLDYETENARGLWNDWGHLNEFGARLLADLLDERLLKINGGPVIERGSNEFGEYTRFPDGTQICTALVDVDVESTASQPFTYPAAFTGLVYGGFSHPSSTPNSALYMSNIQAICAFSSNWTVRLLSAGTSTDPGTGSEQLRLTATGRWF